MKAVLISYSVLTVIVFSLNSYLLDGYNRYARVKLFDTTIEKLLFSLFLSGMIFLLLYPIYVVFDRIMDQRGSDPDQVSNTRK